VRQSGLGWPCMPRQTLMVRVAAVIAVVTGGRRWASYIDDSEKSQLVGELQLNVGGDSWKRQRSANCGSSSRRVVHRR
jgi:hypothetical protein